MQITLFYELKVARMGSVECPDYSRDGFINNIANTYEKYTLFTCVHRTCTEGPLNRFQMGSFQFYLFVYANYTLL